MSSKRLAPLVALASVAAAVLVSSAPAGSISDVDPCPRGSSGALVCPTGTVGTSYSVKFRGDEDPICAPGDDKWYATNGTVPPGLTLGLDGRLSGTPTQEGTYSFWVELKLPDYQNPDGSGCRSADNSEEPVTMTILPGVPRLVIGPESTAPGTVGSAYSLQMTASVSDPKTWSIVDGVLPPGLSMGPSNGLISGTPTAAGSYGFTVRAAIADGRTDTKALAIVVRTGVAISGAEAPASEVGIPFFLPLTASGGTGSFVWSLSSGVLPAGVTLASNGAISGTPTQAGKFPYAVTATDSEGRKAVHASVLTVADRLAISPLPLKPAKVGRYYQAKIRTTGGVLPAVWTKRGPLPKGMRFDRALGMLYGAPRTPGTYRLRLEARDTLGVKATRTVKLVVAATRAKPSR